MLVDIPNRFRRRRVERGTTVRTGTTLAAARWRPVSDLRHLSSTWADHTHNITLHSAVEWAQGDHGLHGVHGRWKGWHQLFDKAKAPNRCPFHLLPSHRPLHDVLRNKGTVTRKYHKQSSVIHCLVNF